MRNREFFSLLERAAKKVDAKIADETKAAKTPEDTAPVAPDEPADLNVSEAGEGNSEKLNSTELVSPVVEVGTSSAETPSTDKEAGKDDPVLERELEDGIVVDGSGKEAAGGAGPVESIFESTAPEPESLDDNELNENFKKAYREIASLNHSHSDPNRYRADVDEILNQHGINLDWDNEQQVEEFKKKLSTRSLGRFDILNLNVKYYKTLPKETTKSEDIVSSDKGGMPKEQIEVKTGVGEGTVRVEKSEKAKNLKEKLEAARKQYIKAKEEVDKLGLMDKVGIIVNVKSFFGSKVKEETEKIKQAFAEKETEFKHARAEYLAENIDAFIEEKKEQLKLKVEERNKRTHLLNTAATGLYEGYKNLGKRWSLEKTLENSERGKKVLSRFDKVSFKGVNFGRAAVRAVNARTAISFGLLAGGVYFGAGSAVGGLAIFARRWMSGAGTGVGLYDLGNALASRMERSHIEKSLEDYKHKGARVSLPSFLASLEAGGLMAGKFVDEIQSDPLYKEIVELMKERQEPHVLENYLRRTEKNVDLEIKQRKWLRRAGKFVSAGAGLIVGSGMLADLVGSKAKHLTTPKLEVEDTNVTVEEVKPIETPGEVTQPEAVSPAETSSPEAPPTETAKPPTENPVKVENMPSDETSPQKTAEVLSSETPVNPNKAGVPAVEAGPSQVETPGEAIDLAVGRRGIEGALLDLRKTNLGQYQKMLEWMKEQTYDTVDGREILVGTAKNGQAITDEGVIIHRFMLKYAHENGYSLGDGGGNDLTKLKGLEITVQADGSVELYTTEPNSVEAINEKPQNYIQASGASPQVETVLNSQIVTDAEQLAPRPEAAQGVAPGVNNTAPFETPAQIPVKPEAYGAKVEPLELPEDLANETSKDTAPVTETASQTFETNQLQELQDISTEQVSKYFTGFPKNSDALRSILGDSEANSFYKELNLSPEKLNALKDMRLADFADKALSEDGSVSETEFGRNYGELVKLMNNAHESFARVPELNRENFAKLTVRDYLIKYAIEYRLNKGY